MSDGKLLSAERCCSSSEDHSNIADGWFGMGALLVCFPMPMLLVMSFFAKVRSLAERATATLVVITLRKYASSAEFST